MFEIKSKAIELVDINTIVPNPKNANRHSIEQIKRLEKLIEHQGFRNPLIISKRTGFLISGHGRLEAAQNLGCSMLPVIHQEFESEAQEYAYLISDNEIARWAELDFQSVYDEMETFDFDVDLLGIDNFELPDLEVEEEKYTKKVESPIYEPTGAKPSFEQMYDLEKTQKLIEQINNSSVSADMKCFLIAAAHRHTQFNYKQIAEYYAHASKKEQALMEESALVVIDFESAIEKGFVKITDKLKEAYINEK